MCHPYEEALDWVADGEETPAARSERAPDEDADAAATAADSKVTAP
ncbi:hypothetical protein [Halarchaeum sp. P4]